MSEIKVSITSGDEINVLLSTYDYESVIEWTPTRIETALWLDASNEGTISLNGSNVFQWDDLSGNGNHFIQPDIAAQPLYNNKTLSTNGSTSFMYIESCLISATEDFQVFIVSKFNSGTSIFGQYTGTSGRLSVSISTLYINSATNISLSHGLPLSTQSILQFERESDTFKTRLNGGNLQTQTQAGVSIAQLWTTIGANWNNYASKTIYQQSQTDYNEIIICNGVQSNENREKIEGYLAHKWGLTAGLATSHPYKNESPKI